MDPKDQPKNPNDSSIDTSIPTDNAVSQIDIVNTEIVGSILPSRDPSQITGEHKTIVSTAHSGAVASQGSSDPVTGGAKGELSTFDATDELTETGVKVLKEKAQSEHLSVDDLPVNITTGNGINLMPRLTKAEMKKQNRKTGINLFSAFAILLLVSLSILILGANMGMRFWLGQEKKALEKLESEMYANQEIIRANNEILNRFRLYEEVQEATFSPREVLIYWRSLVSDFGSLESIELQNGLDFEIAGKSQNLQDLSFLWHLITIDDKVQNANLESFSRSSQGSSFSFEGLLDFEYFAANDDRLSVEEIQEEDAIVEEEDK